mmetsp:Transcript_99364/g.310148  ORF Transcript_99364/g.310148 Transcript_99364/m.310148 type:complete len:109 (-) Transcript_99364:835-1161(-)
MQLPPPPRAGQAAPNCPSPWRADPEAARAAPASRGHRPSRQMALYATGDSEEPGAGMTTLPRVGMADVMTVEETLGGAMVSGCPAGRSVGPAAACCSEGCEAMGRTMP